MIRQLAFIVLFFCGCFRQDDKLILTREYIVNSKEMVIYGVYFFDSGSNVIGTIKCRNWQANNGIDTLYFLNKSQNYDYIGKTEISNDKLFKIDIKTLHQIRYVNRTDIDNLLHNNKIEKLIVK